MIAPVNRPPLPEGKAAMAAAVHDTAKAQAGILPVYLGLYAAQSSVLRGDKGEQFIYIDHAYFRRGWIRHNFRAIRNGIHLTKILDVDDERLERWGVEIKPWRKNGNHIVLIETSPAIREMYGLPDTYDVDTFIKIQKHTDRRIVIKRKGEGDIFESLKDAWAVVCFSSVAAVEAALAGYPVFSSPHCPSYPVSAGHLQNLERPKLTDRFRWACSLTYATWNAEEIGSVDWKEYNYRLSNDVARSHHLQPRRF